MEAQHRTPALQGMFLLQVRKLIEGVDVSPQQSAERLPADLTTAAHLQARREQDGMLLHMAWSRRFDDNGVVARLPSSDILSDSCCDACCGSTSFEKIWASVSHLQRTRRRQRLHRDWSGSDLRPLWETTRQRSNSSGRCDLGTLSDPTLQLTGWGRAPDGDSAPG